jgi:predicted dehydrogenase
MPDPIRMGVIGCGAIAQIMHLPYLREYTQLFRLVALADTNSAVLADVGDFYHVAEQDRHVEWRDVMARNDIDAVLLSHSGSHHDTVIAALDSNKHIFVEKPLGWNVREVNEAAQRAARSDRIVQVGYHKLYDPAFPVALQALRQMRSLTYARITVLHPANDLGLSPHRIRRGNGIVVEGHVEQLPWSDFVEAQKESAAGGSVAHLVDEVLGSRKNELRLRVGYGNLVQSVIHQVYMMFGFLGQPSRAVSTELWHDGMSMHAFIEYPNDLRCVLDYQYLPYLKDYREEYAFFGNHDRVIVTFPGPYYRNFPTPVVVQAGEGEMAWERHITVSYDEAFRNELLAFADNVQTSRQPRTSVSDAAKHIQFIQQMIDVAR